MKRFVQLGLALCLFVINLSNGNASYSNVTVDYVPLQLREFKNEHPNPIGVMTTEAGAPVELRNTITMNSEIFANNYHLDTAMHTDSERIPERVVHARGNGAYGYFEVTHDVSKYISSDVFNGIGKKTPVVGRFSTAVQNKGGTELARETKGLAVKMYTKEGNLDFLCLHIPVYDYRDPVDFGNFIRAFRRNPKTNIIDATASWDFVSLRPDGLHAAIWRLSDYGIPYGYRRMDIFPIHAYEIHNKHGEKFLAKFNFRTELGLANLTTAEANAIGSQDPDFFTRDIYNAIASKNYPSWRLEMDVIPLKNAVKLDYNPFDVTSLWKKGTYKTVIIGRLVLDKLPTNNFKDIELSAFNPSNLVPGIPGPVDLMFQARRVSYRDTHRHRLGPNAERIEVNQPLYYETYTRDGYPPVKHNMKDVPNYYPNSFSGPEPFIEENRPEVKLLTLDKLSVDFEPLSYFYNHIVENDAHRQRIADNAAAAIVQVDRKIVKRLIQLFSYVDADLGGRVTESYRVARERADAAAKLDAKVRYAPLARCMDLFTQGRLKLRP